MLGSPLERLERGLLIVQAPAEAEEVGAVGPPCESTFKQAAPEVDVGSDAAAGMHTPASQSSWAFPGFLLSLGRNFLNSGDLLRGKV